MEESFISTLEHLLAHNCSYFSTLRAGKMQLHMSGGDVDARSAADPRDRNDGGKF